MNKTIIIMFILFLPVVYALYGGETWSYHFDKCDSLEVNITGTDKIDEGEYTILNKCAKIQTNYYLCDCYDDYDFNVTFKINTVNNYTLDFNYAYSEIVKDDNGGGDGSSSGGSSGAFTIRFTNKSRILMLNSNIISRFWVNSKQHTIQVLDISNNIATLEIMSEPIRVTLTLNKSKQVSIDNETLEMTLKDVRGRVVFIEFEKINKEIVINETIEEVILEEEPSLEDIVIPEEPKEKKSKVGLIIVLLIVFIGLIIYFVVINKKETEG